MEDTAKYLIHADLVADGVVERSDVVGAVFGQTEGLLGDDLDIHALQDASKLGRIDVSVETEGGQSFGDIAVASSLDRVETAVLAAALEALERVGPCRATIEVSRIEDLRAAKRRAVTERAKELLATSFDEGAIDSDDILAEVREAVRVGDLTEYEGLPAGPNVATSDAVVVVEGRSDVGTLLKYGVKNAVAVEGTNVPDAVAELTRERTATAFLDGDRGGDLILEELRQVGDVDYVASPPVGQSVEDLTRADVHAALRDKVRAATIDDLAEVEADGVEANEGAGTKRVADLETVAATDGSAVPSPTPDAEPIDRSSVAEGVASDDEPTDGDDASDTGDVTGAGEADVAESSGPSSTAEAAEAVADTGRCRFYDDALVRIDEVAVEDAFEALRDADRTPATVVLDGPVTQRVLDVAAQRGVRAVVAQRREDVVKEPANVAVHCLVDG